MYDSAHLFHFGNARRNQIIKRFITSKVVSKINDNASCLPCFKQNDENFLILMRYFFIKIARNFADR